MSLSVLFVLSPSYITCFPCLFCLWAYCHIAYCRDPCNEVACYRCAFWFLLLVLPAFSFCPALHAFVLHSLALQLFFSSSLSYFRTCHIVLFVCTFWHIESCPSLSYTTFCDNTFYTCTFFCIASAGNPSLWPVFASFITSWTVIGVGTNVFPSIGTVLDIRSSSTDTVLGQTFEDYKRENVEDSNFLYESVAILYAAEVFIARRSIYTYNPV